VAGNSFGTIFRFTTWGESHGPAIGCVVDGTPRASRSRKTTSSIPRPPQAWPVALHDAAPGADAVKILSGVFEGETTGTPIQLLIENTDQRPRDSATLGRLSPRPRRLHLLGQIRHPRPPRRRPRLGARDRLARRRRRRRPQGLAKLIGPAVTIRGALVQIGPHAIDRANWDWNVVENEPFWCPDAAMVARWRNISTACANPARRPAPSSRWWHQGFPPGSASDLRQLDSDIARALMSINAVKGVEIGAGSPPPPLRRGERRRDAHARRQGRVPLQPGGRHPRRHLERQDIVARFAVKPTSSILTARRTVTASGEEVEISTRAPRPLRSASAPSPSARRCSPACWPTTRCGKGRSAAE